MRQYVLAHQTSLYDYSILGLPPPPPPKKKSFVFFAFSVYMYTLSFQTDKASSKKNDAKISEFG